ncbi:glycosyltransferase family 4 protein [Thiocystis violacea]|uniref:glycosyltransferase family 4 protein n=1 Tax=Thiocystis violacea TaxID=13725 RepID=UPI0019061CBE|nr:glycosyltransferase family 4 protein [Thiocystis violacea]
MTLPRVLYVLPVPGSSGGANSVVQEALGLRQIGVEAAIAVDTRNHGAFLDNYPELQGRVRLEHYVPGELGALLGDVDVLVATLNNSVSEIRDALQRTDASPLVAYYVQDYEPFFYPHDSAQWHVARASYELIPGMRCFVKTQWLQEMLYANHGIRAAKVAPSIDHGIYFPNLARSAGPLSIVAMLRPQTPYRGPARTHRIMATLVERYGDRVSLQTFGATDEEIASAGYPLTAAVTNRGTLRRAEVPHLLRDADLFLDLSDYQAFGRTGLEAMASGCVPLLPIFGGVGEYARPGYNAYVVDTRCDTAVLAAIAAFVDLSPEARLAMRLRCIETASAYSIMRAALSELRFFMDAL